VKEIEATEQFLWDLKPVRKRCWAIDKIATVIAVRRRW